MKILITGANRGLGLEFCRQYLSEGAEVLACCRNPAGAQELNQMSLRVLPCDVSDPQSVQALVQQLNGAALDIVINNAGLGESFSGPPDFESWRNIFATNSLAPAWLALALQENLLASGEKKLVTITSQLGSITNHSGGVHAYHASKAAVNNFMRGLALEWRPLGIAVGLFHPGWVQTDMGGSAAPTTPEQSVTGLRRRIAELNLENSGTFRDFENKILPW